MAGKLFDEHVVVTPDTKSLPCAWTLANLNDLAKEFPKDYRIPIFIGLWYDFHGFYDNKYYASALPSFQHALAINPKDGLAHYYIGQHIETTLPALEKFSPSSVPTENDKKLLQEYGTALSLDPTLAPAHMALANIQIYLKHPTLALTAYNKAIELRPNDHEFYNRRAQLLMDMGKEREAIGDFTKAIDNCQDSGLLQAYYEQRAEMYLKVGAFGDAASDYSTAIRLILETVVPHSLGLKQFRKLYSEYDSLSDQTASAKLQALLRPGWQPDVFLKTFTEAADGADIVATELSDNYTHRGAAYWLSKNYKRAIADYQRVFSAFPKYIKENPDALDRWKLFFVTATSEDYVDVKTADYSQPDLIKLWLKLVEKKTADKSPNYSLSETHVNCATKMIGILSATHYDAKGSVLDSVNTTVWQKIVPETLGEALYEGMCRE
jgi:tetratricopeptide (TPR) repeat protein